MKTEKADMDRICEIAEIARHCIQFAAILLAVFGLALLITATGGEPLLKQNDPLLGLSNCLVLALAGLMYLGVGVYLFTGRSFIHKAIALLWPGFISLIFGYGSVWAQRRGPCPVVVLTGWRLGIWPATMNLVWIIFIAYLFLAGTIVLVCQWKLSRAPKRGSATTPTASTSPAAGARPKTAGGFTFIELVSVLAVLTLLAAVALKASTGMKEHSRRALCRNNLNSIAHALQLYTLDNGGLLPDCTRSNRNFTGTPWTTMWNTNLVEDFAKRGIVRKVLYCPSNAEMDNTRHWDYYNYEHVRNRFVGYELMLPGIRELPENLWRRNLEGGPETPDKTELALDIVACTGGQPDLPLDATANARVDYRRFQALFVDRTSHLAGVFAGLRPAGGNIAFEDGHVAWRDFSKMQHRYTTAGGAAGPVTWDF